MPCTYVYSYSTGFAYQSVDASSEREDYMVSIGATYGGNHVIRRSSVFEDVMQLYQQEQMAKEFPVNIKFESEKGVDVGGVTREMYSAFWEKAYGMVQVL